MKIENYLIPKRPPKEESSVHYNQHSRLNKAREEAKRAPFPVEEVVRIGNEFLGKMGVKTFKKNIYEIPSHDSEKYLAELYDQLKDTCDLADRRDILWIKFARDGYVGVVAKSNDINFKIPKDRTVWDETNNGKPKTSSNSWKWNTSGIIIESLGKQWNESFVVIFPIPLAKTLSAKMRKLEMGKLEHGLGGALILADCPILDYYSHTY
ncbi:hypothetical protein OZX60_03540 [Streptococcaceae bacterium ESL0687]|nr:hypothetical protein OZX60_03540 [Streptococcaceae bacterium ESL0687]